MKFFIIRHAETELNKNGRIQGHIDAELSEEGKQQAEKLAQALSKEKIDAVYCSDLKRCRQTIAPLLKIKEIPTTYTKKLRERKYGIFEGKPKEEFFKYMSVDNFIAKYKRKIPGGETFDKMRERTAALLNRIIEKEKDKNVLISTHGGVSIAVIINLLNGKPEKDNENYEKYRASNTSLTIINIENNSPEVLLLSSTKHLQTTA